MFTLFVGFSLLSMKRGLPWNDDDSSSDESSADDTDTETVENDGSTKNAKSGGTSKKNKPEGNVTSVRYCNRVEHF